MKVVLALFVVALFFGCAKEATELKPPSEQTKQETQSGEIVTVFVDAKGTILVNGQPSSLDQLKQELARLRAVKGSVRYSRANPKGDPPPNAMEVIKAIADEGLPVQLIEEGEV